MFNVKAKRLGNSDVLTGRSLLDQFANAQRNLLWAAVVAGTISTILLCVMWITFALIVEAVVVNKEQISEHVTFIGLFISSAIGRVVFIRIQTMFGQIASGKIRSAIRKKILILWRNQSPLSENLQSPASSATQWVEDVEAMDGYFSRYWPQKTLVVISPIIILGVVAWINWLCALLLFISAPLIPLFMVLIGMGAEQLNQKYSLTRQRLAGHFLNRVANLTTIKLLNGEQSVFDEVKAGSNHYRKIVMKTLRVAFLSSTVLEFFTSVAIASLAIYIGFSLFGAISWGPASSITLFSGLLILILAPEFFQPLRNLSQYYHDKAAAIGAANNLVDLFNSHESNALQNVGVSHYAQADSNVKALASQQLLLNIHNLALGYGTDQILVKDINLQLKSGQLLAVTGESGTGKTTFLNTLANYLKPVSGNISMSPKKQLALPIAYLPQKPWIKNGTVLENFLEFAPDASKKQMLEVLDQLGLREEFIQRHKGLETLVGEHGKGFSGGQLQRLALCRVMLNPTAVILLDEPTAKLDLESKQYIVAALLKLKKNAIVIVATHDTSLLDIADKHLNLALAGMPNHAVLV